MTQSASNLGWKLGTAISLVVGSAITTENCTLAQNIVPDGTLGAESSIVTTNVVIDGIPSTQIDGRAIRARNLFHSFQEFNIGEEQRVYFTNPPGINNIFTRVTGGSRSEILGKLGVLGSANLFLLNPNGIIFGPNASLNIQGSFLASTASSLNFADGTHFSATAPQTLPLLTISVPIGLQFGNTAAGIRVQNAVLTVQPSQTLGLAGGEVSLENGDLAAPGGRIELGSVVSNSLVSLKPTVKGWFLGYEGVQNFQNIQLRNGSEVNASGEGGGDIQVQGRQVLLADASQITTQGAETAGNLTVTASKSVELTGSASALLSQTTSAGNAGNITINTRRLLINNGAFITVDATSNEDSFGRVTPPTGQAGNLTVNASESVELKNGFMFSNSQGSANAGNITINTEKLLSENGAVVSVSSFGTGDAGDLKVTASSILLLRDKSEIATDASRGSGNGGDINIDTDLLIGVEDSDITATAIKGRGGNIQINTQGIFGIEPRSGRTSESDITASSDLGVDGVVEINRPEADISSGLVFLPTELVDVSELIAQGCSAGGGNVARGASKFVATGRGGLPPTPTEALRSDSALADLGTPVQGDRTATTSTNPTNSQPAPIIEAQGWTIGPQSEVVLTAHAPSVTPHIPWLPHTSCNGF